MAGAAAGFDAESETYGQECSYQTRTFKGSFTLHYVQYVRISLFIFQKLTDLYQKLWGSVLSRVQTGQGKYARPFEERLHKSVRNHPELTETGSL